MRQKIKFMTKHPMIEAPNLRQSKKITQPLVVMVETFRMSLKKMVVKLLRFMLKKDDHCQRRSKYQNSLMKSNRPSGFSIYKCGHLVFGS